MFNFINEIREERRRRKLAIIRNAKYATRDSIRDLLDTVLGELFKDCPAIGKQVLSVSCRFREVYRKVRECVYTINLVDNYSITICHKNGWEDMFMTHCVTVFHNGKQIAHGEYDATSDPLYPCASYREHLWAEQENVRKLYSCLESFVAEDQTETF